MKKLLLSLSALVILGLPKLMAQDTIPNLGFEIWSPNALVSSANDPNTGNGHSGWWDFNVFNSFLLGSSPVTVFEGSSNPAPNQGFHYAEIVSNQMTLTSYGYLKKYGFQYARTNGLMFLAYLAVTTSATIKSGVPISNALKSFSFNYRYIPNGNDSCSCTIGMFHWNSVTKKRDLIGGGFWGASAKQPVWTLVNVPIFYDSANTTPDTVFIAFSASKLDSANSPQSGDTLDIDGASIALSINNLSIHHDNVTLYPNPANNQISLAATGQFQASLVEVYDITGKLVNNYSMHNNLLTINTQQYPTGIYFYKMYDNTGVELNVGKFSVIK